MSAIERKRREQLRSFRELCDRVGFELEPFQIKIAGALLGPQRETLTLLPRPVRIYDLRSTFASDALAASVSVFQLARIMGTSVRMIERHYGALLDGSGIEIAGRLDALDAQRAQDG